MEIKTLHRVVAFEGEANVPLDYAMEPGALIVERLSGPAFTLLARAKGA